MSIRQLSLTAVVVMALAGCSTGSSPGTSTPPATTAVSTSAAPAASSTAQPVAGGGATDFCSAYAEYRTAVEADTPQAQGAGFRAAATDLRTYAPAEIKDAAGLFADVMDEVGQAIQAGGPNPEVLGSGQSEERRQALADSITWITNNCP
jgi:ABC-type phosphate transport system substrate-binding protein